MFRNLLVRLWQSWLRDSAGFPLTKLLNILEPTVTNKYCAPWAKYINILHNTGHYILLKGLYDKLLHRSVLIISTTKHKRNKNEK